MSGIARGVVAFEGNIGESAAEGVLLGSPVDLRRAAADMAIGVMTDEPDEPSEDGPYEDGIDADSPPPGTAYEPRQRTQPRREKIITLDISLGQVAISRQISAKSVGGLRRRTRLLLGVGQANASQYSFLTGATQVAFIRAITNKGVAPKRRLSERSTEVELGNAEKSGTVRQKQERQWELTPAGMEWLLRDEDLRKRLRNLAPVV
jgi:hypothetical protein